MNKRAVVAVTLLLDQPLYNTTYLVLDCCQTSQEPKKISCTEVMCHSHDHTRSYCTVEDLQTITSVALITATHVSDETCRPNDGPHGTIIRNEGTYGFYDNYIWVDNSCRALFSVCGYQDRIIQCIGMTCNSEDHKPNICKVRGMERVTSVAITAQTSASVCTSKDGPPIGEYGFNDTYIWVDYGCRATFKVCGNPAHLLSSSTAVSEATIMPELLPPTTISTKQTSLTVSPMLPTVCRTCVSLSLTKALDISTPPNLLSNKALKQDVVDKSGLSVDTVLGITFGSVAGVALLGGGTFLLYRLVSRNSVSPEYTE